MSYTKENFKQYLNAQKIFRVEEDRLFDRIEEVYRTYGQALGFKLAYWHFPDAFPGEVGTCKIINNTIEIVAEVSEVKNLSQKRAKNKLLNDYNGIVYIDDLFLENKAILQKINDQLLKLEEAYKTKKKKTKSKQAKLKEKALQKLSAEEKKALNLS